MNNSKSFTTFFLFLCIGFNGFSQGPEVNGQWSDPILFDIVPVAVANLPDGRLLTWSSKSRLSFDIADGLTFTQIFDPSIGLNGATLPDTQTTTNHDMFCPGINNLADGRILATGGSSSERASIYNPSTETWTRADDLNIPRGYQGAVTLSDGSAFTIGGSWSGGDGNKDAEIWTEELGWRVLTGLENELLWNENDDSNELQSGAYRMDNHAWLWPAPNGKVFHAGPGEMMHWFDVSGDGSSEVVKRRGDDIYSMNGTTVMFDIGKILKYGGSSTYSSGTPSSDNAYVIDINDENNVTVTRTSNNAAEGRVYTSSVVLPSGEVLILGGMDTSTIFSDVGAHLTAEMYNPDTNSFRTLASMQVPRTYHSAGIILNDGRVFFGGGGLCGNNCPENHTDAEIFSPPYLFNDSGDLAVRPNLSAPDAAYYETPLKVVASPGLTEFAFIRFSSATHSTNNEQRRVPVEINEEANGTYELDIPNANLMPPGYYMLFALNAEGVPSLSETVLIGPPEDRIMEANLLVEFDFFEGKGAVINDTSGKNNNGEIKERDDFGTEVALSDDYWNADGFSGSALQMDGLEHTSNSIVQIPTSPTLAALTDQITVMAWVNRDTGSVIPGTNAIPNVAIFAHDYDSFFFGYHNLLYKLEFFTDTDGSDNRADCYALDKNGEGYKPGEWEHLVGTYDGSNARLYLNGEEICNDVVTGTLRINTLDDVYNTFTLAGFYDDRPSGDLPDYANESGITDELDGSMDKFKLYNVALTAEQIQSIYDTEIGTVGVSPFISCESLEIVYEVNGESGSGETEITVTEGDDVGLFLNLEDVAYTITAPDGSDVVDNVINNITIAGSGIYTINSTLKESPVTKLTAIYADSEETIRENGRASNVVDGNPETIWHTVWSTTDSVPDYPHEIIIDLGANSDVSGLEYIPRQLDNENGTIDEYEIYVSETYSDLTTDWGDPVASGTWTWPTWPDNEYTEGKTVDFPQVRGHYVRLVALSEVNNNKWASAGEINIVRTVPTECVNTILINVVESAMFTYDNNDGWTPSDPNIDINPYDDIVIESGEIEIYSNMVCRNITINPGAALIVDSDITLAANTTTLTSTGDMYSSLIVNGTIEGTVKYERFVNANIGGNDLISSPFLGQTWADFLSSGTNATDLFSAVVDSGNEPTRYAFGPFDKDSDSYLTYTDDELPGLILESGTGFRAATNLPDLTGTTLTFTGTVPTTQITVDIRNTVANGHTYPEWNLIGNPYPSYLDMYMFLNYETAPSIKNLDILENASGIYGYVGNGQSNKWSVITLANASSAELMAPGQGFFVAADADYQDDYDITFDPSMRAISGGDDFVPGRNAANELSFLKLNVSTEKKDFTTEFYFNANASKGLDHGYDGKILGNVAPGFAVYSHLVEDNTGLPIALQALNPSDLADVVIPLGVNSNQGDQITFSKSESTLSSDIEVYLEDKVTNTNTLLNTGDYKLTPNVDLRGTGRFYLRTTSTTLSVGNTELDYLQIYTTVNPKSLIISGKLNATTTVNLYDIQGRLVLKEKLDQFSTSNTIDISTIGTGVYIVKVSSNSQSKTQKLVIK